MAGIKTTSYAENVRALAYAKERGCTEALFENTTGLLCEGTGSNVFVGVAGRLLTPPLSSGCLAGRHPRPPARGDRRRGGGHPDGGLPRRRRGLRHQHRPRRAARPPGRRPPVRDRGPLTDGGRRRRSAALVATTRRPLTALVHPPARARRRDDPSRRSPSTGTSMPPSSPTSRSASVPTTGRRPTPRAIELFLTVHDLTAHRNDDTETEDGVFQRLTASFTAARALHDGGLTSVLAPTPTADGHIVDRLDHAVHAGRPPVPPRTSRGSSSESFASPSRTGGRRSISWSTCTVTPSWPLPTPTRTISSSRTAGRSRPPSTRSARRWDAGPYGESAREYLEEHASGVQRLLVRLRGARRGGRTGAGRAVVTHGEPHAANVLVVDDQLLLIDWDTALVARARAGSLAPRPR